MSIGGPQAQPLFMKAVVNPATPEKISQKHIVVNIRIEQGNGVQEAGQAGRSREKLIELKEPLRVPSTRRISSGFEFTMTTCSLPESSLSDWVTLVGAFYIQINEWPRHRNKCRINKSKMWLACTRERKDAIEDPQEDMSMATNTPVTITKEGHT